MNGIKHKTKMYTAVSYFAIKLGEHNTARFLFYKEPSSRPSSKSSLFFGLFLSNSSTKSSLIVP